MSDRNLNRDTRPGFFIFVFIAVFFCFVCDGKKYMEDRERGLLTRRKVMR
ncbi:Uncharacterized protein APZ42_023382 [Daphnia magna]|uniref:Uncharacterized protein n=1 Tax=Daphnia magna TaxID=35525 RepID=A0A164UZX4_9CRUS|nr:Uncharacterized protein APZ42_023382 [Daphnia magna]